MSTAPTPGLRHHAGVRTFLRVTGPCCRSCGGHDHADARSCDGCGQPLA